MGEQPPSPRLLDLLSRFISHTDELLTYIGEMEKRREARDEKMLAALNAIAAGMGIAPTVVVAPGVPAAPAPAAPAPAPVVSREVIALPAGALRNYSSVTTTTDYQTVAKIKPHQGMKFKIAKILVSCPEDVMAKLQWAGQDLGPEVYVMAKLPFTDWFGHGFRTKEDKDLEGDGSSEIQLQVKYPSGGTAATCHGEISGDEEA